MAEVISGFTKRVIERNGDEYKLFIEYGELSIKVNGRYIVHGYLLPVSMRDLDDATVIHIIDVALNAHNIGVYEGKSQAINAIESLIR